MQLHGQELLTVSEHGEFRDIFWRGLKGMANLQAIEIPAFATWAMHVFRTWETFWYQWQEGIFDENLYAGYQVQFCDLLGYAGILEVWKTRQHQFSAAFREYTNQNIAEGNSRPLYVDQEVGDV